MDIALGCLIVMALAIYLLAIVTDEYFIVSLDRIAHQWGLPSNVAGASLMAMGSSAPELAIALFALFKSGGAHSDVGIGTIVGSAVFNILVITGASAIAMPARVTWRVVMRDVVLYVASIALLLMAFADGRIMWFEALAFLFLYAVYLFLLSQWKASPEDRASAVNALPERADPEPATGLLHRVHAGLASGMGYITGDPHTRYIRTFLVCVVFIAAISWVLVDAAVLFADAIGLPPVIVALTILAAGTSVPDMMASIIVARQGRGEMAIANAVGSNIFDILIGLGLPWMLALLIHKGTVQVGTGDLWFSTIILLSTVVLLFVFLTTDRILSRKEGWALLGVYGAYVIWTWIGST
jgi:K+-dependent Na+/Ca+ exchanger-like protein